MITPKEVKSMNIQDVVNDTEWQRLRKSLIGHWVHNHTHNVNSLKEYFINNFDDPLAIRRLVNVLTGSVHRVGHTKGQLETDQLRKEVRIRWKELLNEDYDPQDPKYKTGEI
jgi:hypothetical protein|tara:strand:+ start:205 stop:540 length:336 start_codon:yes stop_codon:yes gene_type:complete